jgi:hypothetical protein
MQLTLLVPELDLAGTGRPRYASEICGAGLGTLVLARSPQLSALTAAVNRNDALATASA